MPIEIILLTLAGVWLSFTTGYFVYSMVMRAKRKKEQALTPLVGVVFPRGKDNA